MSIHAVPLLLSILVGLLLAFLAWGLLRVRRQADGSIATGTRDELLLGLLALAAFCLGAFVTYMLLIGP
jgi:hypothetical protein